jgi:general stress protein YciG
MSKGETMSEKPKGKQGFASMDRDRVKEIASKGGQAIQRLGVAHRFNSRTGHLAGLKGGRPRKSQTDHPA